MSGKAFGLSQLATELPQLRFIPVGKSISAENRVSTYDQVTELINGSKGPFAILECSCRKMADMKGQPCKKTSRREVCLAIGDNARNSIANSNGRAISREEALEITRMNEADGLVFETSNTQNIEVICSCCGCCCGPLAAQKMLPKPLDFAASNYQAWSDATTCSGCGTCVERCQVNAVTIDDGTHTAVVDLDRCLGCGNCVVTCPTGAMKLMKKQTETVPPRDMEALYDTIMANKKGPFGKMKLVLKLMLKR